MSVMRQRYRVAWDDGEPVIVTTNARDIAAAAVFFPRVRDDDPESASYGLAVVDQDKAATDPQSAWRIAYAGLVRAGRDDLPDYDKWVDVLDECTVLDAPGPPAVPTIPAS